MRLTLALMTTIVGLIASPCFADTCEVLATGNAYYREGEFERAAEAYVAALEQGHDGPAVHYNLGNALHHIERRGEAIAHYLTAARMAPRDADIRANLERALAGRPGGPPAPPLSWSQAAASRVVDMFTLSELALTATVCLWVSIGAAIALLLRIGNERSLRRMAIVFGALAVLFALMAFGRWWRHHRTPQAVVTSESSQMRSGPGESFESVRTVGEGWIVRVLRDEEHWAEVVDEAGARGWLRADALTYVNSRSPVDTREDAQRRSEIQRRG